MRNIIELTNHCICLDDDGNPANDCWDCYQTAEDNLHYMIVDWLGENDAQSDAIVEIKGKDMTWQRLDGAAEVNANSILSTLELERAQYRIQFELNGKELTAKRWSHDEPMGASFTFNIKKEQDNG